MLVKKLMATMTAVVALLGSDVEDDCNRPIPPGDAMGNAILVSVPVADRDGTDVVLFFDEAPSFGEPDGVADRVFRLQMASGMELQDHMVGARVSWTRTEIAVAGGSGEVLELTTAESSRSASSALVGYGLAHTTGWKVLLPTGQPTAREYSDLVALVVLAQEEECDSGGAGSEKCNKSCRGGTCSAKCDPGYYACCSCEPLSCGCVKESPSQ